MLLFYLELRGFFGESKLEVPLSGVGSSSGKESNSDACLFKARAFRGLIVENKDHLKGSFVRVEKRRTKFR